MSSWLMCSRMAGPSPSTTGALGPAPWTGRGRKRAPPTARAATPSTVKPTCKRFMTLSCKGRRQAARPKRRESAKEGDTASILRTLAAVCSDDLACRLAHEAAVHLVPHLREEHLLPVRVGGEGEC